MYPEGGDEGMPPMGGLKSKASYHLEGIIPLIIIVIIIVFAGTWLGLWDLPWLPWNEEPADMLVVGNPSFETRYVLDSAKDIVRYRIRDAASLEKSPTEQIAQYDIVMIDQSSQANKEISAQLGEAIESWVKKGGKLIIVKDSGIYQKGAAEVIGWKATFGDVVPVECGILENEVPSCIQPINVFARIYRQD